MIPWHLGSLHGYEQALTLVLAFAPFVLLAVVILVRRRQDAREQEAEPRPAAGEPPGDAGTAG